MKNKKIVSISIVGILLSSFTQLNAISINNAVEASLTNHPIVKSSESNVAAKIQNIEVAKSGYYPTLDISADYGKERKKTNDVKEDSEHGYHIEVTLKQNLFSGFYDKSSVEKAKSEYLTSNYEKYDNLDKLTYKVISTYIEIVRLRKTIESFNQNIFRLNRYYKLALKMKKSSGKESQPLIVFSKLQKSESELSKNKSQLEKYNQKFFQLTGVLPDEDMNLQILDFVENHTLNEMLDFTINQHNELNKRLSEIKVKNSEINISKSQYYPNIDFTVKRYKDKEFEIAGSEVRQTSGMFNVKYNIFNGFKNSSTLEKQRAEKLKLVSDYDKNKIEQQENTKVEYALYLSAKERMELLEKHYKTQEKLTELFLKEFKIGKRTILNLVDSEEDFKNSKTLFLNAYADMVKGSYSVAYSVGNLNEILNNSNLKDINYSY